MSFAYIASAKVGNGTTSAIDTTGARLLVAVVCSVSPTSTLTDSKGNSWTKGTDHSVEFSGSGAMFWVFDPIVGSGHTFTNTTNFPGLVVAAYSADSTPSLDAQSGSDLDASPANPGSITPSQDNCLLVTGYCGNSTSSASVDSGFTLRQSQTGVGGINYAAAIADLVQTTASAQNPGWTFSGGWTDSGVMAVFKMLATGQPAIRRFGGVGSANFRCGSEGVKMWRAEPRRGGLLVPDRCLVIPQPEMRIAN